MQAPPESTATGSVYDLAAVERELRGSEAYTRDGHTARTLVREPDLRLVLIVMNAGSRINEHSAHETASIHVLSGHLRLRLPSKLVELPAGQLLALERGLQHDVEAAVESAFLLSLGWPRGSPP